MQLSAKTSPALFYALTNKIIFQNTIKFNNNFCKELILFHVRKIRLSDDTLNQINRKLIFGSG
ncbi:MAG: hypothetical protein ACTS7E_00945 [Arsenophonus sp. NC-CH8-MAG3]